MLAMASPIAKRQAIAKTEVLEKPSTQLVTLIICVQTNMKVADTIENSMGTQELKSTMKRIKMSTKTNHPCQPHSAAEGAEMLCGVQTILPKRRRRRRRGADY